MAFITLRANSTSTNTTLTSVKTTPLTNIEIDNNFINLNNDIGLKTTIGIPWVSGAAMSLGQFIYYSANPTSNIPTYNWYQVTTAGTMPTTAPTHTTGVVSGLTYIAKPVYSAYDVLTYLKTVTTPTAAGGLNSDTLTFNAGARSAASTNTVNSIVARDASGNFAAQTITAVGFSGPLTGNVTGNVTGNITGNLTGLVVNGTGGNAVYTTDTGTVTNTMLAGSIANAKLVNSSITINSNAVALGGSLDIHTISGTWTTNQVFKDNLFSIIDDADNTKTLSFQLNGLLTNTPVVLSAPTASMLTLNAGIIPTQQYVDAQDTYVTSISSPAGAVSYFAMSTAPTGWIKANGAAISRTTYAALFAVIGTYYGAGDGLTTFNLPDLRGQFLRAWDDARGVDAGRGFGSTQGYDWKTLYLQDAGQASASNYTHDQIGIKGLTKIGVNNGTLNLFTGYWSNLSAHINGYWGSEEVRPTNVALLACIKY